MEDRDNTNIHDASAFEDSAEEKAIIKVIGVGGGGGNAVNYMYAQKIPGVNFVVCNSDEGALKLSPVPNKLIIGYDITHGLGAGNKPEVGRECAEASAEDIKRLFEDQTEMVFITAGMGGGTGTGAGPVVARLAKEAGMLTIGIVTVPFVFEGEKKILKALEGANEMAKHVDALLVINNENLIQLYPDYGFWNAFEKSDDTLANAARSISEIISENLYINVDFQDVKTTLKDSGTAIIATAYGEGEHRITKAIENALHSPLLKTHDIKTAKRLLLKFGCSRTAEHELKGSEIAEINNFTAKLPQTIDIKWGIGDYPELGDKVKVTVLAAGFDVTLRDNNDNRQADQGEIIFQPLGQGADKQEPERDERDTQRDKIKEYYGTEYVTETIQTKNKMRYAVLRPGQFDDDEIISIIERTPALNRDPNFLAALNDTTPERPAQRKDAPKPDNSNSNVISF